MDNGVYPDLDELEYHAMHDRLSSSGARNILPPSCPAEFKWAMEHREEKRFFDLGHAAHKLVLGVGLELVVIDAKDYRTKAAQTARDEAHARGAVPLLAAEHRQVQDMADALTRNRTAADVLSGTRPEVSVLWEDERAGCGLRCRLDASSEDFALIVDYKTAVTSEPAAFARACANYGYHQQDDFYRQGVIARSLHPDPEFLFVVQSKTPPYEVSVVRLEEETREIGWHLNRQAIDTFASCQRLDLWPGWGEKIHTVGLTGWARRSQEDILNQIEASGF